MTERKQETKDIISKIIDEMPGGPARSSAEKALEKLPGVSISGNVEQLAITLSGPIHFAAPTRSERRP